jgi:hypothetical protein
MKSVTVSIREEELEVWKEAAWRERKTLSAWVRDRCGAKKQETMKTVRQESPISLKDEDKKPGVQVSMNIPANTVTEASARLEQMVGRSENKEAELKRLREAGKAFEKRYGSK